MRQAARRYATSGTCMRGGAEPARQQSRASSSSNTNCHFGSIKRVRFRCHFRSNDFIVLVVPQRPCKGVGSNPTAVNLKADAERLEKARAEISKKAARWRGKAARLEKVNDDVAQNLAAVKEEIADLKKLFWPASLSRNPDVVAAALAAVDAAPLADVRGTFWPDTSEITLLEAAVLSGHAKTRRDTRRLCLDSVLVFADVRRKKRTSSPLAFH